MTNPWDPPAEPTPAPDQTWWQQPPAGPPAPLPSQQWPQPQRPAAAAQVVPGSLLLVGAVVVMAGALMPWERISIELSNGTGFLSQFGTASRASAAGTHFAAGNLALLLGIGAGAVGLLLLLGQRVPAKVLGSVAALGIALLAGGEAVHLATMTLPIDGDSFGLHVRAHVGPGPYVVIGGAVIALVGSLLSRNP